jgi:hypothetical protein
MILLTADDDDDDIPNKIMLAQYSDLGYRLDDRGLIPGRYFFLYHCAQTGSGVHPASRSVGTARSISGGKVAGAWG